VSEGLAAGGRERHPSNAWADLEATLRRVAAVEDVRVRGSLIPNDIRVVATADRDPHEVINDVVSVVSATTNHSIDPADVSLVQLRPPRLDTQRSTRAVIDAVVVATRQETGWVKVRVRLPNGVVHEGSAPTAAMREQRAAGAVEAVLDALGPLLHELGIRVQLDAPALYPVGTETLVVVHGTVVQQQRLVRVSGSAFVVDDTPTAAARASLDALNRHLRLSDG